MTEDEYRMFKGVKTKHLKYWIPFTWFSTLLSKAKMEGRILSEITYNQIMHEMLRFRQDLGFLLSYDWVTLPLVYTQVVTLAVYSYFFALLFGRQFLYSVDDGHKIDLYIPYFTIFEFIFYMGLLKVAEVLINPHGEDDEDFEINEVIDRNIEVSLLAVDKLYDKLPKLQKDKFWKDYNINLPYAPNTKRHDPFIGSTIDMREVRSRSNISSRNNFRDLPENIDENGNIKHMNNNKAKEMRINMEELEDYSHPTRYSVNNVRNSQLLSNFEDDDTYAGDSTDLDDDNLHSQLLENDQIINEPDSEIIQNDPIENQFQENLTNSKIIKQDEQRTLNTKPSTLNAFNGGKTMKRLTKNQRNLKQQRNLLLQAVQRQESHEDSDQENVYERILQMQQARNNHLRKRGPNEMANLQKKVIRREASLGITPSKMSSFDSPYGSITSFATSIPSPRPLRWYRNPSISGTEISASEMSEPVYNFNQDSRFSNSTRLRSRYISESSGIENPPTNYHDEVVKRLQVVPDRSKSLKISASRESIVFNESSAKLSPSEKKFNFEKPEKNDFAKLKSTGKQSWENIKKKFKRKSKEGDIDMSSSYPLISVEQQEPLLEHEHPTQEPTNKVKERCKSTNSLVTRPNNLTFDTSIENVTEKVKDTEEGESSVTSFNAVLDPIPEGKPLKIAPPTPEKHKSECDS